VEVIRGKRTRIVTSCNYPAQEGIEVKTKSDRVIQNRKMVLEWLLGRCSEVEIVKNLAREYGITKSRFGKGKETCILCGMCARVCHDVVGAKAIGFSSRGVDRALSLPFSADPEACIGCGACAYVCPTGHITMEDLHGRSVLHHEARLGAYKPIATPFMQAVPNKPRIDTETCIHFKTGRCKVCAEVCEPKAINHDMKESFEEVDVGAIIVSTGFQLFDCSRMKAFGHGVLPNVVSSLEFEKLCHASGPTGGKVLMENGETPKSVAILHCVGSRDTHYNEWCSRVCCMYSLKYAHLIHEKTGAQVYQLYIDMRCPGKGYEQFYRRLMKEGVIFVRGKGAEITRVAETPEEKGKLVVKTEDTLLGMVRRIPVDMVVLAAGLEPGRDAKDLGRALSISCGDTGFYTEKHPKLGPVSTATDGIFLAGACQGPKDIPDSVAQGGAAAMNALALIDWGKVDIEPITAWIDETKCSGCKTCIAICPYQALSYDAEKKTSVVNEALCKGCGSCVATCPSGASDQRGFRDSQIFAELEGALLTPIGAGN
jgi:heterodisulfide reductase subunit A